LGTFLEKLGLQSRSGSETGEKKPPVESKISLLIQKSPGNSEKWPW